MRSTCSLLSAPKRYCLHYANTLTLFTSAIRMAALFILFPRKRLQSFFLQKNRLIFNAKN